MAEPFLDSEKARQGIRMLESAIETMEFSPERGGRCLFQERASEALSVICDAIGANRPSPSPWVTDYVALANETIAKYPDEPGKPSVVLARAVLSVSKTCDMASETIARLTVQRDALGDLERAALAYGELYKRGKLG
jgi:hypothetical protein